MHLTLTPQQGLPGQPEMTINVTGDILTLDGIEYDLSPVPEGGEGWPDDGPFIGPVTRIDGVICATIITRLGDSAAESPGGPWVIEAASGDVEILAIRKAETEGTA